jgi:hypothetical protein
MDSLWVFDASAFLFALSAKELLKVLWLKLIGGLTRQVF